jgi:hypothetical protein
MKIILGFFSLASSKRFLTSLSDSPYHLLTKSDEDIEKKVLSHSVAHAFARKLLPVPGGPYNKIPAQGFLAPLKSCGNLTGMITASLRPSLADSRPDTSSHLIFGFSYTIALARAP